MSKQLTMKAGVAMFAALALAVALAILAFAYQPVAAQTDSDGVTRSFSATEVATGGTVDVTITLNSGFLVKVTETLPDGWTYQSVMPSTVDVTENGQMITFDVLNGEPVTYTVMAPNSAGSGMFSGMYAVTGTPNIEIGGDDEVTVRSAGGPMFRFPIGETAYPDLSLTAGDDYATVRVSAGQDLNYSATSDNEDVATAVANVPEGENGYATVTVTAGDMTGSATITVTASDDIGGEASTTFTANVGNNDPVVSAVSDQTFTAGDASRQVRVMATDADGHALTYTAMSNKTDVATVTVEGYMLTVTPVAPGTATITVTASDPHGGSGSETFTVTVTNAAPAFVFPSGETAYPSLSYTAGDDPENITVSATDSDGHDVSYMASSSDDDVATVTNDGNVITVTPYGDGNATITVKAYDAHGGSASTTFDVIVSPVDPAVVLSSYKADTAVTVAITAVADTAIRGGRNIVVTLSDFHVPGDDIDLEDQVIIDGTVNDRNGSTDFYGNPASVSVSGDKVTLSLPTKVIGAGGAQQNTQITGPYTIFFKQGAGLKTPNASGPKTIEVADRDSTNHELTARITSHISVKPGWLSRGTDITVTAKGVNPAGDTTAHLYTRSVSDPSTLTNSDLVESSYSLVLGRASNEEGTVIIEGISTSRTDFIADAKNATTDPKANAKGVNLIVMVDSAGNNVGHAYLGLLPSVELDVTDVRRTGEVKVKVSDWYYGSHVSLVKINGITVNLPDDTNRPHDDDDLPDPWDITRSGVDYRYTVAVNSDGEAEFTVVVDRNTRLGEMQVEVHGANVVNGLVVPSQRKQGSATSMDIHKQTVQVGFFPLTITPSNEDGDGQAVTEQVIQIEGEEFLARACITSVMVGERDIDEATNGDTISSDRRDCVDTDSNGKLTATFLVPRGLKPGTYDVVVRDDGNRVGEARLVIPKPAITLDPMTSQRGSTVTVVGENFPANDVVTIDYRGITVEAAQTDTVGNFRATFKVPITAPIGADHEVLVASENKADGLPDAPQNQPEVVLTAKMDHHVSDEYLRFDRQQVAPGEHLGIISGNLPLFTPVSLSIGGRAVAGKVLGEDNASDGSGEYIDSVLVPQLPAGITIVELTVHTERGEDVRVAEFVEITDIVTRPTVEVFEDLIAAGQLESVWRYRIDETGSDWDSFDPQFVGVEGINDLELVSTDDIVWIHVNENAMFQGALLIEGWNLRTLE